MRFQNGSKHSEFCAHSRNRAARVGTLCCPCRHTCDPHGRPYGLYERPHGPTRKRRRTVSVLRTALGDATVASTVHSNRLAGSSGLPSTANPLALVAVDAQPGRLVATDDPYMDPSEVTDWLLHWKQKCDAMEAEVADLAAALQRSCDAMEAEVRLNLDLQIRVECCMEVMVTSQKKRMWAAYMAATAAERRKHMHLPNID